MLALIVSGLVVAFDLLTKYLSATFLEPLKRDIVIIPKILNFSYVENRGAAFGILKEHRWIFMTLSVLLIFLLIFMLTRMGIKNKFYTFSVSLILGGGIGNMIDRIFLGYVVDFIKVTFVDFPVFNIADSAVVVGTILLGVYFVFFDKSFRKAE